MPRATTIGVPVEQGSATPAEHHKQERPTTALKPNSAFARGRKNATNVAAETLVYPTFFSPAALPIENLKP